MTPTLTVSALDALLAIRPHAIVTITACGHAACARCRQLLTAEQWAEARCHGPADALEPEALARAAAGPAAIR